MYNTHRLPAKWSVWLCTAFCVLFGGLTGCQPDAAKEDALDQSMFRQTPPPGTYLTDHEEDADIIQPGRHWMGKVGSGADLTFASWRKADGTQVFCIVVLCDPDVDRLVLMPLGDSETPLTVLANPARRNQYEHQLSILRQQETEPADDRLIAVSITKAIENGRLGPPLPPPQQVLAVAANFPSHLKHDLAMDDAEVIEALRGTRPRIFLKYPPTAPLADMTPSEGVAGIIGPFDPIRYPADIHVPVRDAEGSLMQVPTSLDYEAEIGLVIGRRLTWDDVVNAPDEKLYEAISGYLLISDSKARNPQVVQNIISRGNPLPADPGPYLTGNEAIDRQLGFWDKETCRWWSYAAGGGDYAGLGPLLVAAPPSASMPDRMMLTGRSYAAEAVRGKPVPPGHTADTFYLRQSVIVSSREDYEDRMLWTIPQIIRSALAPNNALDFLPPPRILHPGDIISLGTPGGTVITVKPKAVVDLADALLFWWEPLDWHDAFFGGSTAMYLNPGDEVFFWAQNLGYQRHLVKPFAEDDH